MNTKQIAELFIKNEYSVFYVDTAAGQLKVISMSAPKEGDLVTGTNFDMKETTGIATYISKSNLSPIREPSTGKHFTIRRSGDKIFVDKQGAPLNVPLYEPVFNTHSGYYECHRMISDIKQNTDF